MQLIKSFFLILQTFLFVLNTPGTSFFKPYLSFGLLTSPGRSPYRLQSFCLIPESSVAEFIENTVDFIRPFSIYDFNFATTGFGLLLINNVFVLHLHLLLAFLFINKFLLLLLFIQKHSILCLQIVLEFLGYLLLLIFHLLNTFKLILHDLFNL